jgi:hypothetical protein
VTGALSSFVLLALVSAEHARAQVPDGECVPVKPWATLEDPVRLCAYLADDDVAAACEARGFRLGEGVDEIEARNALQTMLLCQNEYVIGVERDMSPGEGESRLAVTTAIVRDRDAASGFYDHGKVRILARRQGTWAEDSVSQWSD